MTSLLFGAINNFNNWLLRDLNLWQLQSFWIVWILLGSISAFFILQVLFCQAPLVAVIHHFLWLPLVACLRRRRLRMCQPAEVAVTWHEFWEWVSTKGWLGGEVIWVCSDPEADPGIYPPSCPGAPGRAPGGGSWGDDGLGFPLPPLWPWPRPR